MIFYINEALSPSKEKLYFYMDGSFGPERSDFSFDFEINVTEFGVLEIVASLARGLCFCLMGFSWKSFKNLKKRSLFPLRAKDAALCFKLEEDEKKDVEIGGLNTGQMFKPTCFDPDYSLVLFGERPVDGVIYRFAYEQYVVFKDGCVKGFIFKM